jgi:hypothetical protein
MQYRHDAVEQLIQDQSNHKIVLTDDAQKQFDHWVEYDLPVSDPMIACEEQRKLSLEIDKLKGKNTRKYWHVFVTRKDNGCWEAYSYPL